MIFKMFFRRHYELDSKEFEALGSLTILAKLDDSFENCTLGSRNG